MKKKNIKSLPKFDKLLKHYLDSPAKAAAYLSEALKNDDYEYFLISIKDIIKANGGFTALADKLSVSRTSLYKSLSLDTKVGFLQLHRILKALGIDLLIEFQPIKKKAQRKAA